MKIDSVEVVDREFFVKSIDYGKVRTITDGNIKFIIKNDVKSDVPDIDYDCADPMEAKELFIREYGENSVVPISNYNTLQIRSLIKDISKLYGIPYQEVNDVTSKMLAEAIPKAKEKHNITAGVYNPTFDELKEFSPTLQNYLDVYPHIATHIENLHGQIRSISRHAGGVLFADNLNEKMPLINSGGVVQTPWTEGQTVRHLEPMGFIKFDILGLASLRMVETCIKHILKRHHGIKDPTFTDVKKYYDENLHPSKLNLSDPEVYKNIFHAGKFAGTFQFTAGGAQEFCMNAKPMSIIDIAAITSIYRPGPLSAEVDKKYVEAMENPESISYIHPIVKDVLGETYGYLVFQEQLSMLAHKLGKEISLDEGNELRKVLTKKGTGKEAEVKAKLYSKFKDGCVEKGLTEKDAGDLWKNMEFFSGYGFNLSHAVCYSILSYQCAYLLNYYPSEWMVAFLDKEPEDRKELAISIAKSFGFNIQRLDINLSHYAWEIHPDDNKTLIQPLSSIKGLGDTAIQQIMSNRPFKKIEELIFNEKIVYSKLNKKALDVLIRSQALNCLMDDRFTGLKHFWSAVAVDRPKTPKKFLENIEKYKDEGDFSVDEKLEYMVVLTGVFPINLVMNEALVLRLEQKQIKPISQLEESGVCWFVTRSVEQKKSKSGKDFFLVKAVDITGASTEFKIWSINLKKDVIYTNHPYMGKMKIDSWGVSTNSIANLKMLA